jgi:FAD-dependent oxidoreductase domain-containing protein 1
MFGGRYAVTRDASRARSAASIGPVSQTERADVVIVGGAIIGSSVATFLAMRPDFDGRIVVVERDPTFRTSSTTLSAASIRLQFSTPLNIEISRFGVELISHLDRYLAVGGEVPEVDFVENGYLFLATDAGLATLEHNHAVQRALDVPVALLTPAELRSRFAWLHTEDLAGGSLGLASEGWFDAYALLQGFRRRARALGVEERTGEVVGLERDGDRIGAVRLADGSTLEAGWVVDAAGPRAAEVAAMAGIELPVRPRKRFVYHVEAPVSLGAAPLTIDPSGVYVRPEGPSYITGYSPHDDQPDPDTLDLVVDRSPFEELVWPTLAHRIPAFDRLRLVDAWAGHYEVNTLDHNAIVGPHPTLTNLLFANGFSGHGLQQAPAVGRGLAEWIATGRYETLDLSPLGYERIERNEPIRELNVV